MLRLLRTFGRPTSHIMRTVGMPTVAERAVAIHTMPFGAELRPDGAVRFRLWAPGEQRVRLVLEGRSETLADDRALGRLARACDQ